MNQKAAQKGYGGKWPSEKPVGVIVSLVMASVSAGGILLTNTSVSGHTSSASMLPPISPRV